MTTTTAADATQGHGKNSDNEQRLQAMGDRLKQVLGTEIGVDREQVLAKVAELRALAKELEDFAGSLNSTAAKPVLVNSTFPRSTRKTMVKMPRLGTVFADASGEEGGEFNTQVAIPPGGLTFIASAAVMQESDDDSVSASVDIADIADAMRGAVLEPNDVMPTPARAEDDGPTTVTHAETGTESVGGFAHPTESFAKTVLAQATEGVSAAVVAPQMPIPADHTPAAGEVPPPSGFDVYGMASWAPPATPVSASAVDGSAAPSAMPAMYGALPLPYPLPHPLAMHCGFLPPLMYGVPPSMGSPVVPGGGAAPPPPPGLGSTGTGHSLGMPPSSAGSSDALAAQQQSELWVPEHGVVDASGVPRSKMVMAMPGTDHYQHAVAAAAAAAAAGYPMNVPFMYPHIDSSNISAAATGGGSENNESVVSVDSNRGVASRFGSMHYPPQHQQHQQQHQQVLAGDSARGFNMSGGGEYPPATQYMWPEHSKHMAQGAYPYVHQGYHQGSAGHQGYRRRGSGSNNSSGSGSANGSNANTNNNNNSSGGSNSGNNYHHNQHHQHQSRDRRGNTGGGYPRQQQQQQQQQRWNNNNNNNSGGYNPRHQHHHHHHNQQQQHRHQSPHNSSTYSQDAGSAPGFSGVAASEVSIGPSNSGYYSNNNNIPK